MLLDDLECKIHAGSLKVKLLCDIVYSFALLSFVHTCTSGRVR